MQASYMRGNQKNLSASAHPAQRRRTIVPQPIPQRSARSETRESTKTIVATADILLEPSDDAQPSAPIQAGGFAGTPLAFRVIVDPDSLTVVRGEPLHITVTDKGAFNIEWSAHSLRNDDTRYVSGGTVPFIDDYPIVDTTYEVHYQVRTGTDNRYRIVGEHYRAAVRVLNDPDEASTGLRLRETGRSVKGERAWFAYRVANNGKVPLDEICVEVELPDTSAELDTTEARKHAPNTMWKHDAKRARIVSMDIGSLKVGEAVDVALAFNTLSQDDTDNLDIDRASAYSKSEDGAEAPVGLRRQRRPREVSDLDLRRLSH